MVVGRLPTSGAARFVALVGLWILPSLARATEGRDEGKKNVFGCMYTNQSFNHWVSIYPFSDYVFVKLFKQD